MSSTSSVSHFASTTTSDEIHQLVTSVTIPDQPPDHVSPQQDMADPSTEPKFNIRKRRWNRNIVPIFKDSWRQHRREMPLGEAPGVRESITAIIKTSWLNALLIFIPLSWIFHYVKLSNTLVFVFSFFAIVPLAKLLDFATDDLSLRFGQIMAGLLKTTLVRLTSPFNAETCLLM